MELSVNLSQHGDDECSVVNLGEAEVEVSLQGAPLGGDDLVEDWGQQEGQGHPQGDEEEAGNAALAVVAVMFTIIF